MRIIHTADWHLGQYFFGYDRRNEHEIFLEWLLETVRENQADALLLAGDVFDGSNPSADSQHQYYRFLHKLTVQNPGIQAVIIAGNHDSAARLESVSPLLESQKVFIRGLLPYTGNGQYDYRRLLIPLYDRNGVRTWCAAVPFLRVGETEGLLRNGDLPETPGENRYKKGVSYFFEKVYESLQEVRRVGEAAVIMGHLQASGSEISEGDRSERVVIGGVECVYPEVFDRDIAYVALGHLHRAQRVSGREHVRYAGAPLPMSFAEHRYSQGVNLVEIESGKLSRVQRLEFAPPVSVLRIPPNPEPFEKVLACLAALPDRDPERTESEPYLEVRIRETHPQVFMKEEISRILTDKAVRLAKLSLELPADTVHPDRRTGESSLSVISPFELARRVYRDKYGEEMPAEMQEKLNSVIREVE